VHTVPRVPRRLSSERKSSRDRKCASLECLAPAARLVTPLARAAHAAEGNGEFLTADGRTLNSYTPDGPKLKGQTLRAKPKGLSVHLPGTLCPPPCSSGTVQCAERPGRPSSMIEVLTISRQADSVPNTVRALTQHPPSTLGSGSRGPPLTPELPMRQRAARCVVGVRTT
jgi:hypothetical protein